MNSLTRKKEGVCGGHSRARPFLEGGGWQAVPFCHMQGREERSPGGPTIPFLGLPASRGKATTRDQSATSHRALQPPLTLGLTSTFTLPGKCGR